MASDGRGPLLLLGGGSGLVPLTAMLRHRAAVDAVVDARLLVSAGGIDEVLYREELTKLGAADGLAVHYTLTRDPPTDWAVCPADRCRRCYTTVGPAPARGPRIYACGPSAFVEGAANILVALGHAPGAIRTERFGPTG